MMINHYSVTGEEHIAEEVGLRDLWYYPPHRQTLSRTRWSIDKSVLLFAADWSKCQEAHLCNRCLFSGRCPAYQSICQTWNLSQKSSDNFVKYFQARVKFSRISGISIYQRWPLVGKDDYLCWKLICSQPVIRSYLYLCFSYTIFVLIFANQ